MQKKRIFSTVVISVLTAINLVALILMLPLTLDELLSQTETESVIGYLLITLFGITGVFFWAIVTLLVHAVCLCFSLRNMKKSSLRSVRVTNTVLTVLNLILILGPAIKMILWSLGH